MPIRAEFRNLYRHQWLTVTRPRVPRARPPPMRTLSKALARLDLHLHLEKS
jgi:hypothetical protein